MTIAVEWVVKQQIKQIKSVFALNSRISVSMDFSMKYLFIYMYINSHVLINSRTIVVPAEKHVVRNVHLYKPIK